MELDNITVKGAGPLGAWSRKDEAEFQALFKRRERVLADRRARVVAVAQRFDLGKVPQGFELAAFTDRLIRNARDLCSVLEPYVMDEAVEAPDAHEPR